MKFEMEFGFFGDNKLTVETHDFEMIQIFQKFVEFQENHGWAVDYERVVDNEEFDDEDGFDDEQEAQELDGLAEYAAAEAAEKE